MSNPYEPPKESLGDAAHGLVRGALDDLVPGFGGTAAELFSLIIQPPLQKRLDAWRQRIADGLFTLEQEERLRVEDLPNNPVFIDAVLQTSQAAMKTSHEEKLEALRNAVLNSALPHAPDQAKQHLYIHWVDSLSVWHLRVLRLLADPPTWFRSRGTEPPRYIISASLWRLITDAFPELRGEDEFGAKIATDLFANHLTRTDSFKAMMSSHGTYEQRATALGKEFLKFVSSVD